MTSTQIRSTPIRAVDEAALTPRAAVFETKLEILVIPVSDVDRSKTFYQRLGWRLDADFANSDGWRVVQLTPPGSACSILLGKGITTSLPGSVKGTFLIVDDIAAARAKLVEDGVAVSDVFHFKGGLHVDGTNGRLPGPDPEGQSYKSWASFEDPDGNSWMLQEIKTRLPGRGFASDVPTLIDLLREAENRHGDYALTAPKHHWSEWYAAYVVARERGKTPDEAAIDAAWDVERAHA